MIRMPLKLTFGPSSGRYELSEDIYILTILVGEQTIAQCTLTTQSKSTDVFRYLAEKHCIKQLELFGLQYQMKATDTEKRMMRWIEPDKPIRRQLERWACRRGQKWAVNLAILHACSNVFILHDTVSRNVYYTLLKLDVLQGHKYAPELDKCINLAAYQLQIEFPDLCSPTLQHLKMLSLLPQSMCRNPKCNNDETYGKILASYEKLHTMQPAYAALLYIVEVQQCEGYGEEAFPCKDGTSLEEVSLGYSLDWIFVRRPNGTAQKYRWEEIREITAKKRKVTIKCGDAGTLVVFCFEDKEMARYVSTVLGWKWHHARNEAQREKNVRLSVQNLQGSFTPPTFSGQHWQFGSHLRRSTGNVNSVRPSADLNMVNGNGIPSGNGFLATASPYALIPTTPQMSASRTESINHQSTIHSVQSASRQPINVVCCRSVSVGQMPPATIAALLRPPTAVPPSPPQPQPPVPTGATFYPQNGAPSQPTQLQLGHPHQQQTSHSSQDSDWLRNERREVLKKMLMEKRRLNKIGSSPEINTVGLSKGAAVAKCKRQQQQNNNNAGGGNSSGRRRSGFALARKIFTSTPNLNSTAVGRQGQVAQQLPQQHQALSASRPNVPPPAPVPMASPLVPGRLLHPATSFPYCSPPPPITTATNGGTPAIPPNLLFLQQNGVKLNGGTVAQPQPLLPTMFSHGQMIDENGQQRPIIYPVPPEAAGQPPAQLLFSSNSPPPPPLSLIGGGDESRSSPKSNATSSHSEPPLGVQSSLGSDGQPQSARVLPEFSELEFSGIPAKSLSGDYSVAVRPHNLHRNRGSKIYPYNENRVRLAPTKANPDGYINASHVNVPVGKHCQLGYVVSQAPIAKTIQDFWQLVWETGARLIVMLVNPHQINKDDTVPSYIPKQAKEKLTVGEFFLRLESVSPPMQMQFQSTTTFTLSRHGERRTIWHLYCADFSEQGVPSSLETFIGLIDAVASVKRHIENETKAQQQQQQAISKSNSNASKESKSSSDTSKRDRTQSAASENGWTKKLRFETSNGHGGKDKEQKQQQNNRVESLGREDPLTIIQCTDGASESGLYLLAEVVIRCMESNAAFDIAQLLRDLRYQRMCLVKNASQYKFVYELASFYERKSRLV